MGHGLLEDPLDYPSSEVLGTLSFKVECKKSCVCCRMGEVYSDSRGHRKYYGVALYSDSNALGSMSAGEDKEKVQLLSEVASSYVSMWVKEVITDLF